MRSRLLIIISVILLVLILAGIGIYLLVSNGDVPAQNGNGGTEPVGLTEFSTQALSALDDPKDLPILTQLSDLPSDYLNYDGVNNQLTYYNSSANQIFTANALGYGQASRSEDYEFLVGMDWSDLQKKSILLFQELDSAPVRTYLFDNTTFETKKIEGFFTSLTWSKDSSYLIGYRVGGDESIPNGIVQINIDTLAQDVIFESDLENIEVIPYGNNIAYYVKTGSLRKSNLYMYDMISSKTMEIVSGYYNLEPLISPDSSKLLFSGNKEAGQQPELFIKELADLSNEPVSLNIQTFASKCVWRSDNINVYCGIPANLFSSRSLYEDYTAGNFNLLDSIWTINTESLGSEQIIPAQQGHAMDIRHPNIGKDNDTLYFINRRDDFHIWAVNLDLLGV